LGHRKHAVGIDTTERDVVATPRSLNPDLDSDFGSNFDTAVKNLSHFGEFGVAAVLDEGRNFVKIATGIDESPPQCQGTSDDFFLVLRIHSAD
jgi:hypothetical protein